MRLAADVIVSVVTARLRLRDFQSMPLSNLDNWTVQDGVAMKELDGRAE